MTLSIQDLKNRKSYIIAKVASYGLTEKLKSIMSIMMMEVEGGRYEGTVADLLTQIFDTHYRARTKRSGDYMKEVRGGTGELLNKYANEKFGERYLY